MITKPMLPPKDGYVEVEVDGVRQYAPTPELHRRQEELSTALQSVELAQQAITDQELNNIETNQRITDLELTILGGTGHV